MAIIFFANDFYSMEPEQHSIELEQSYFAYVQFRGCELCEIEGPACPVMRVMDYDIRVDSIKNDNDHTKTICVHSCMGPSPALTNFCKKEEKNDYECREHKNAYTGRLGQYYNVHSALQPSLKTRVMVKDYLFIGNDYIVQNADYNKKITQEMAHFFKNVYNNHIDVSVLYNVLAKRWNYQFLADICPLDIANAQKSNGKKDFFTKKNIQQLEILRNNNNNMTAFALSDDGLTAVVGFGYEAENLFLLNNKGGIIPMHGHIDPVTNIVFSKNGELIVSTSDGFLHNCITWDAKTGEKKIEINGQNGGIVALAVSPDATLIATIASIPGGKNKRCCVWDANNTELIAYRVEEIPDFESLEFSDDGTWLMGTIADEEHDIVTWKIKKQDSYFSEKGMFSCVAAHPSGKSIAFAARSGLVGVIDLFESKKLPFSGVIKSMVFNKSGSSLFLAGLCENGTLFSLWNLLLNKRVDLFFIPSVPGCPSTGFSLIMLNERKDERNIVQDRVLFASGNSFVLGALICP